MNFYKKIIIVLVAMAVISPIYSQILEEDSLALVALYNNTGGENWNNNSNWLDGFVKDWYGIVVEGNRVKRVELRNNNLVGNIPSEISGLTELTHLYLQDNELYGAVPTSITSLSKLERFYIFNNNLTDLPDLSSIETLNWLEISSNAFTFEDIEPNIGIDTFYYSFQDSVGEKIDTSILVNSEIVISVDVGGSANNYQWYRENILLPGEIDDTLIIPTFEADHEGIYTCSITNDIATELTLFSRMINISLLSNTAVQDSLALIKLYENTDGPNWNDNTNWLEGPISEWYGIFVKDNRVKNIVLRNNNLFGSIPPEIGYLTDLEILYLNSNSLEGSIPIEIGNLQKLISLNLNVNNLEGELPDIFEDLQSLELLSISSNIFSGKIPESIWSLQNLKTLELQLNEFSDTISNQIAALQSLEYLILGYNKLYGNLPADIVNLSNLKGIYLNSNLFEGVPDLSPITTLESLMIDNNNLTFEDIEPNLGFNYVSYSPQNKFGEAIDTTVSTGSQITLSAEMGGSANVYKWTRDGFTISGGDEAIIYIDSATSTNSGRYMCEISNGLVENLVIYTNEINVVVEDPVGITEKENEIPRDYQLFQNFPNPFNPSTTIKYVIPPDLNKELTDVNLSIYDIVGNRVAVLVNEKQKSGNHNLEWNAKDYPSGVYIYQLKAGSFRESKKLILLK